jgi:DNA-binding transcriptional LysR family regulator
VPASAGHLQFPDIVLKPLWESAIRAEIHLAWRADSHNPALDTLRRFALQHCMQRA